MALSERRDRRTRVLPSSESRRDSNAHCRACSTLAAKSPRHFHRALLSSVIGHVSGICGTFDSSRQSVWILRWQKGDWLGGAGVSLALCSNALDVFDELCCQGGARRNPIGPGLNHVADSLVEHVHVRLRLMATYEDP